MRSKARGLGGFVVMILLGLAFAGAPMAQTTTTSKSEVLTFEVLSVDGNFLVFHDQKGTHGLNVPNDFRFTVDGKKMAVSELKPGMKGTAVVTTTTYRHSGLRHRIPGSRCAAGGAGFDHRPRQGWRAEALYAGPVGQVEHPDPQGWALDAHRRSEGRRRDHGDDRLAGCAGGGDRAGSEGIARQGGANSGHGRTGGACHVRPQHRPQGLRLPRPLLLRLPLRLPLLPPLRPQLPPHRVPRRQLKHLAWG